MKTNTLLKPTMIVVILAVGVLACSLTAEPPATLPPRTPMSTLTPQGPLGPQATLDSPPQQFPPQLPTNIIPQIPPNPSITSQIALVDANRMMNTITALVGFQNRHALSVASQDTGIHAAGDYLFFQFMAIKDQNPNNRIDVFEHTFTFTFNGQPYTGRNIILIINGTDTGAGAIILGAHYDTINTFSIGNATTYQPGANDNGSGVAAVLEIARIMAQQPHRTALIFALFSAEEQGKFGSEAFLKEYVIDFNINVRAMINLDIIGSPTGMNFERYDNQMRVFASPPGTDSSHSQQLARVVEFTARYFIPDMRVNIEPRIDRPGRWGDHEVFSSAGIDAVRLIEQEDDANRVHTARDDMSDIEADYLRRTTQVTLATLMVLADGPDAPTNIRIDPSTWRIDWLPSQGATRYVVALRRAGSLVFNGELVSDVTSFSWPEIRRYEAVSIAAVDQQGRIGRFSNEVTIPVSTLSQ